MPRRWHAVGSHMVTLFGALFVRIVSMFSCARQQDDVAWKRLSVYNNVSRLHTHARVC